MTKIKFRCFPEVTVEAAWDETVLDALLRSGTPVPFFCRSGICGRCKSVLDSGEVLQIGNAPQLLTEEELAASRVLICRSVAVTDCEIVPLNLPRSNDEAPWPGLVHVVQASWVAPALFHVRVAPAAGEQISTFLFHPGQYSRVQGGLAAEAGLPSRLYPATRPGLAFLDFYFMPKGEKQVGALASVFRVGATLEIARPVGASCLKEGERGPAVLVSTPAGLPAVLSMLELLRLREDRSQVRVALLASSDGLLERQVAVLCADGGIDLQFANEAGISPALEQACDGVFADPCSSGRRPQAYIKGDANLVRVSRAILYTRGFKPWDVHAEIMEGAVPTL